MANLKNLKKLPGVLSLTRCMVNTDGVMRSIIETANDMREEPVMVKRHGIRGTQNINKKGKISEVSNIQVTESAKTHVDANRLEIEFSIRFLPLANALSSCSGKDMDAFLDHYDTFLEKTRDSEGLQEIARRFARNILNGRFLWRNRSLGEDITVRVAYANQPEGDAVICAADALNVPIDHFNDYSEAEDKLGRIIAESLAGKVSPGKALNVVATIDMGFTGSIEVYPSENYAPNKPKGFARALYKIGVHDKFHRDSPLDFEDTRIMGQAALRDQKIGNAIRTIDTWYPAAQDNGYRPIAVEPQGANLSAMDFFRRDGTTSAFDLAVRMGELEPNSPEGMFMIASLIRGGVYGESDKESAA